jgi:hypothetical protein
LQVTSVIKSGGPSTLAEVKPVLVAQLASQLGLRPEFTSSLPPLLLHAISLPA